MDAELPHPGYGRRIGMSDEALAVPMPHGSMPNRSFLGATCTWEGEADLASGRAAQARELAYRDVEPLTAS